MDSSSEDEEIDINYDRVPRAVVPSTALRNSQHPVECEHSHWDETKVPYGLGLYVEDECGNCTKPVPLVYVPQNAAKNRGSDIRPGWYAMAAVGKHFSLNVKHYENAKTCPGFEPVFELYIDGANLFGDAGACSSLPPGHNDVIDGYSVSSSFEQGATSGRQTICKFRFRPTQIVEKGEKVIPGAGTLQLKMFFAIAIKQKLSLGAYEERSNHCGTKAVSERDAKKGGIGVCVERGGAREARTVRRAGYTYEYDPDSPIGVITIHLRERFWLEARHVIGTDGNAYVPINESIDLTEEGCSGGNDWNYQQGTSNPPTQLSSEELRLFQDAQLEKAERAAEARRRTEMAAEARRKAKKKRRRIRSDFSSSSDSDSSEADSSISDEMDVIFHQSNHNLQLAQNEHYTDEERNLQMHPIDDDEDDPSLVLGYVPPTERKLKIDRCSMPNKKSPKTARSSVPTKKVKKSHVHRRRATESEHIGKWNMDNKPGSASKAAPKRRARQVVEDDADEDEALLEADRRYEFDDYDHHAYDPIAAPIAKVTQKLDAKISTSVPACEFSKQCQLDDNDKRPMSPTVTAKSDATAKGLESNDPPHVSSKPLDDESTAHEPSSPKLTEPNSHDEVSLCQERISGNNAEEMGSTNALLRSLSSMECTNGWCEVDNPEAVCSVDIDFISLIETEEKQQPANYHVDPQPIAPALLSPEQQKLNEQQQSIMLQPSPEQLPKVEQEVEPHAIENTKKDAHGNESNQIKTSSSDVVDLTHDEESKTNVDKGKKKAVKALVKELREWRNTGIKSKVLESFSTSQIAGALSAFIVGYDAKCMDSFQQMKLVLEEDFSPKFIQGANFVDADDEDKKYLTDIVLSAIASVAQPNALQSIKQHIRRFFRLAAE